MRCKHDKESTIDFCNLIFVHLRHLAASWRGCRWLEFTHSINWYIYLFRGGVLRGSCVWEHVCSISTCIQWGLCKCQHWNASHLPCCCWHCNVHRLSDHSSKSSLTVLKLPRKAEERSYSEFKDGSNSKPLHLRRGTGKILLFQIMLSECHEELWVNLPNILTLYYMHCI